MAYSFPLSTANFMDLLPIQQMFFDAPEQVRRIVTLDIVRGFALLGILIMNMPGFSSSFFAEADGSHQWTAPLDQFAEAVRDMLFSGKFNSMFSMLFGIGFIMVGFTERKRGLHDMIANTLVIKTR